VQGTDPTPEDHAMFATLTSKGQITLPKAKEQQAKSIDLISWPHL
jgi:hypothetical protein